VAARVVALACAIALVASCSAGGAFECTQPSDCASEGGAGTCESTGYCSFPDATCDSGRRYGEHAPGDVAGTCVPTDVGETGGTEASASDDDSVSEVGPTSLTTDPTADPTTDPGTADTTSALDDSTSAGSTITATSLETSITTATDEDTTAGPKPFEVDVVATIAVCTEPMLFDPEHCALEAGMNQFTVDISDDEGNVSNAWIRFDLGNELANAEILAIELTLTTGPESDDASGQTGELWRTAAFDLQTLEMTDPETVEMIAEDLGPVASSTEVSWPLPLDVVDGASIHLALLPTDTDGIDYWGTGGNAPPRLTVLAQ